MTEKIKYIIRRVAKLTLTTPIWLPLLTIGIIASLITYTGILIEWIGKSLKNGGRNFDTFLVNTVAHNGSWCDKMADWVNK